MKRLFVAIVLSSFAFGPALAQGTMAPGTMAPGSCATKAVGSDGKPLAGAAKTSFMKKCQEDTCAAKAVGSDGRPLAGAAKASFMKKCKTSA